MTRVVTYKDLRPEINCPKYWKAIAEELWEELMGPPYVDEREWWDALIIKHTTIPRE